MNLPVHIISGGIISFVVFILYGVVNSIAFFCFAAFLDLDHYIYYIVKYNKFGPGRAFKYFDDYKYTKRFCICIFHTVEFLILFGLIAFFSKSSIVYACFAGFLLHYMIDVTHCLRCKCMGYRWWSAIEYFRYLRRIPKRTYG